MFTPNYILLSCRFCCLTLELTSVVRPPNLVASSPRYKLIVKCHPWSTIQRLIGPILLSSVISQIYLNLWFACYFLFWYFGYRKFWHYVLSHFVNYMCNEYHDHIEDALERSLTQKYLQPARMYENVTDSKIMCQNRST